jgi:hypothetical protein
LLAPCTSGQAPTPTITKNCESPMRARSRPAAYRYNGLFHMGDFNLDVNWPTDPPCAGAAPAPEFLCDFSDMMALMQKIKDPTRTTETSEKIIDLFLTDVPPLWSPRPSWCRG